MIKTEKIRSILHLDDRNSKVKTGVWFPFALFIVAVFSLNCSGDQQEKQNEKQKAGTVSPLSTPEGATTNLYSDSLFFNLRNAISTDNITRLSPYMTTELAAQFEVFNKDIEVWLKRNEGAGLKLPISQGRLFLSYYEGADSFKVGKSSINGKRAKVPVSLSITDFMGSYQWTDVVLLKKVGDEWLLNNIEFQTESDSTYTLRDRITLVQ